MINFNPLPAKRKNLVIIDPLKNRLSHFDPFKVSSASDFGQF